MDEWVSIHIMIIKSSFKNGLPVITWSENIGKPFWNVLKTIIYIGVYPVYDHGIQKDNFKKIESLQSTV